MRELGGITDSMHMSLCTLQDIVEDREARCASQACKLLNMNEGLNNTMHFNIDFSHLNITRESQSFADSTFAISIITAYNIVKTDIFKYCIKRVTSYLFILHIYFTAPMYLKQQCYQIQHDIFLTSQGHENQLHSWFLRRQQ